MPRYTVVTMIGRHSTDHCEIFDNNANHPHRRIIARGTQENLRKIAALLNEKEEASDEHLGR